MLVYRARSLLAAALLPFGIAALVPATAAAHSKRHHRVHRPVHSGIPQHGGGDGDSDNFGAPTDGDGNL